MINEHDLILRTRNGDKAAFEEISNKLNIPVYKIESRLYMARKRLLKQITENKNNSIEGSDKCEM